MGHFEQLLAHIVGDYILQTDRMARLKTASDRWAGLHVLLYCVPFLILGVSLKALVIIGGTHYLIDRYRLALVVVRFKTVLDYSLQGPWEIRQRLANLNEHGFPQGTPAYLGFWIMVIIDNFLHIAINAWAISTYG